MFPTTAMSGVLTKKDVQSEFVFLNFDHICTDIVIDIS